MTIDLTLTTPALLFSTASLLMLAFTNRFMALAKLVRELHADYQHAQSNKIVLIEQIRNLQFRVRLVRNMQFLGVSSLFMSILSMLFIYLQVQSVAAILFGLALLMQATALAISVYEISISVEALKIELSDMEHILNEGSSTRRLRDVFLRRKKKD